MRKIECKIDPDRLLNRNGAFFTPVPPEIISKWRSFGFRLSKTSPLTKNETLLIDGLAIASERAAPNDVIDNDQLIEAILSAHPDANINQLAHRNKSLSKELSDAGVFIRHTVRNGKRGTTGLFTMQAPEDTAEHYVSHTPQTLVDKLTVRGKKPGARNIRRIEEMHELLLAHNLTKAPALNTDEPWSYHLVTQLLERCSRPTQTDPRTNISGVITVDGEVVMGESAATVWSDLKDPIYSIVTESDANIILTILSIAMQTMSRQIDNGKPLENRISIDLLKISQQLNTGNETHTYRAFQKGMTRIINTQFKLTAQPNGPLAQRIKQKTGQPGERIYFRLIDNVIEGSDESGTLIDTPEWDPSNALRYVTFSLADWIWRDLFDGRGWVVHPGLLTERSGLAHKLYNHLKIHSNLNHEYCTTGEQLEKLLNQTRPYPTNKSPAKRRVRQFCQRLWSIFSEHATRTTSYLQIADTREPIELLFFDLHLVVTPSDSSKDGLSIRAWHSEESRRLLDMQQQKLPKNRMETPGTPAQNRTPSAPIALPGEIFEGDNQ